MADPAERDLDEHFATARLGYRNIFHRNDFGVSIETLGPHGVNHFAPFAATDLPSEQCADCSVCTPTGGW